MFVYIVSTGEQAPNGVKSSQVMGVFSSFEVAQLKAIHYPLFIVAPSLKVEMETEERGLWIYSDGSQTFTKIEKMSVK